MYDTAHALNTHHPVTPSPCAPALRNPQSVSRSRSLSWLVSLISSHPVFPSSPGWSSVLFLLLHTRVRPQGNCLRLTYFTRHRLLQFHPRPGRWRAFFLTGPWCSVVQMERVLSMRLLKGSSAPSGVTGGRGCCEHWGACAPFTTVLFGVNTQCICWVG